MKLLVTKNKGVIKPAYNSDYDNYSKIPNDEVFEIEYKKKRNINFHRKYFALLNLFFDNTEYFVSLDHVRAVVLIHTGHTEEIVNPKTGEINLIPKSIQFSKMDEIEFSKLYEDTKNFILDYLDIENEDLETEIERYF